MHFSASTLTSLATGLAMLATASARPSMTNRAASKSMMAAVAEWTIESMERTCNAADTECAWSFAINTNTAGVAATPCNFTVAASGSTPASQSPETGATCGVFTVTSGWSGYFGPGNGFTTLSVVDYAAGLIVWPAYTDAQLANGSVVTPDQSYAPQTLG